MRFKKTVRIRLHWYILLALLVLPHAASLISFTSKYQGKTVTGLVGGSVNFTWSSYGDVKEVRWGLKKYGGNGFESNGTLVSLGKSGPVSATVPSAYNGRVNGSRSGDASSAQVIFTLSSITKSDERFYGCLIIPTDLFDIEKFDSVYLAVKAPPQINISSVQASYNEGSSVNISCTASGTPDPDVIWIRNGEVKTSGKNTAFLTFNSINRADDGQYTCRANNTAGNDENHVTLTVYFPVQFTVLPQNVTVNETNPIVMSCDASGFPTPSLTWTKNGQVLSQLKQLAIQRSNRSDAGMYVCIASNGVEQDKTVKAYTTVQYPPTIQEASTSATKSWIGQTVTLACVSDGVPTSTLTWYKPDGTPIRIVTAYKNTVNVKMKVDKDFGGYKCDADNGLTPADFKIVKIEQIKEPGSPAIISSDTDIQATSLTVKWTAPADDGGSPIIAYRVVILKTGTEIKNENITDLGTTSLPVGGLERATKYNVKVFARNPVFEGPAGEKTVTTKYEGVPAAAEIEDLPSEVTDDTITLKWSKPQNNGKVITQYTVYQRIVTDGKPGEWKKLETITDSSDRELTVELEKDKVNEFAVTATNEVGESLKEDGKIMRVRASEEPDGGGDTQTEGDDEDDGVGAAVYAGAAAAVVLFIVGVVAVIFLWRRRKASGHDRRFPEELGSENPIEMEDGYQSISREAAQSLQASGPAVEVYANVDLSKKIKRTPQKAKIMTIK